MTEQPTPTVQEKMPATGVLISAAAAVIFAAAMSQTAVATALPAILGDLDGLDYMAWVITAYLIAATVGTPIFGKLADLYGRRIVLQFAIGIFLLGSLASGLATDMFMLIIGRGIQGTGGGGLMVVAITVIVDALPPRERGKVQGIITSVFGVSTVIGPLLGGFLVEQLSWHWIFYISIPIGLGAFIVISFILPPSKRVRHIIDYTGAAMLAALLASTVLLASMGGNIFPWNSPAAYALMAMIAVSLVGFIFFESRAKEPILPLGLFKNNNFVISNSISLIAGATMFGSVTFTPLYMQVVKGMSPANSGLFILVLTIGLLGTSTASGYFVSYTGRYKILPVVGLFVLSIGMAALASLDQNSPIQLIVFYMFVVGCGLGPANAIAASSIQNAVPQNMLGVATASVSMFRLIGGSIGVSVFGALFSTGLTRRLASILPDSAGSSAVDPYAIAQLPPVLREQALHGFVDAIQPIFIILSVLAFTGFVISLFMEEVDFDKVEKLAPLSSA